MAIMGLKQMAFIRTGGTGHGSCPPDMTLTTLLAPRDKVTLLLWGGENPSIYGSDGQMYTMTSAECSSKINSFLSHLNTKLRRLPVFRLKLHWLSGGTANGPVADLVHRSGANGQTNN